jgi:hypothetical protein
MSLKNYVVDEDDLEREESINKDFVGKAVWLKGEITEVAADGHGLVLVNLEVSDDEGEFADVDVLVRVDSDYIKVTPDEDTNNLIDG